MSEVGAQCELNLQLSDGTRREGWTNEVGSPWALWLLRNQEKNHPAFMFIYRVALYIHATFFPLLLARGRQKPAWGVLNWQFFHGSECICKQCVFFKCFILNYVFSRAFSMTLSVSVWVSGRVSVICAFLYEMLCAKLQERFCNGGAALNFFKRISFSIKCYIISNRALIKRVEVC